MNDDFFKKVMFFGICVYDFIWKKGFYRWDYFWLRWVKEGLINIFLREERDR